MKKTVIIVFLLAIVLLASCTKGERQIVIIENGETNYKIVISEKATDEEKSAAKMLRSAFSSSTGVVLQSGDDWLGEGETPSPKEILIGQTNRAETQNLYSSVGFGSSAYSVTEGRIVFVGNGEGQLIKVVQAFADAYLSSKTDTVKVPEGVTIIKDEMNSDKYKELSDGYFDEKNGAYYLINGDYVLEFSGDKGFCVRVIHGDDRMFMSRGATVRTVDKAFNEKEYIVPYRDVIRTSYGYLTSAEITTDKGSVLAVTDVYFLIDDNCGFAVDRTVKVIKAKGDYGFESVISFSEVSGNTSRNGFEYFIPSIIYKSTENMPSYAVMSDLDAERNYVKETRCGTPLAMLRNKSSGNVLTVLHYNPRLSNRDNLYRQVNVVNDGVQYGSIGYSFTKSASVDYIYPCSETPYTYETDERSTIMNRFHPISEDFSHSYTVALIPDKTDNYQSAMIESYRTAFLLEQPYVDETTDVETIYRQNIDILSATYEEHVASDGSIVAGTPFITDVRGTEKNILYGYFVNGFTGAQSEVGFELFREGLISNNSELIEKGINILNFWSSEKINSHVTPITWWIPSDDAMAGRDFGYPTMLRHMVDGADGLLKAVSFGKSKGYDEKAVGQWEKTAKKVADFLAEYQNKDGSFYRAYDYMGRYSTSTLTDSICGESKNNTPIAVAFLYRMYCAYGDEKYKNSAIRAADYSYKNLYLDRGVYIGGASDNPDVPDKEAAIYAVSAFESAYLLTGDGRYYQAYIHALYSAMSWTVTYDYKVQYPVSSEYADVMSFEDGKTSGFSSIAIGHSGIDVYAACTYDDYFRAYIITGDSLFLNFAGYLQQNSRRDTDINGEKGYLYRGFSTEACIAAEFVYYVTEKGIYVPWITVALNDPVIYMEDTFGLYDVSKVAENYSLEQLKKMIK